MNKMFNIKKFQSLNSTNLYAKENINNLNHFDVILAEIQTNGMGRMGKKWLSTENNNLYFSIILKNNLTKNIIQNITQIIAISICRTLSLYDLKAFIKWPNDVLINEKKISGILCENIFKDKVNIALILGIGINVNLSKKSLKMISQPATSIKNETNKNIKTNEVLNQFLLHFNELFNKLVFNDFNEIYNEWKKLLFFKTNFFQFNDGNEILNCELLNINLDGSLKVKVNNEYKILYSGDVILN